jgi:hypothetical protein
MKALEAGLALAMTMAFLVLLGAIGWIENLGM